MFYFLLLILIFTSYTALAWRNLRLSLILLSGLLPIYLLRFSIGPFPTTALEILILINFIIWGWRVISDRTFRKGVLRYAITIKPWFRPTLLLLAAASIAVTVSPDVFSALGIWKAYFIEPILVAVMMVTVLKKDDGPVILKTLALSAIVISALGIAQYLINFGIPVPWDIERRITSIFDYPNALGLFLAPVVAISAIKIFSIFRMGMARHAPTNTLIWILSFVFGVTAIILSKTEAALVAIPLALFLTFLISKNERARHTVPLLKLRVTLEALSVFFILVAFVPTIREKIFLQDYSGQVRLSQWSETIELLKDHPFFGTGLNGYPALLAPYHDATLYEIFQYPHNVFLNIWVELGLLGLIAFGWLAWLILKSTIKQPHPDCFGAKRLAIASEPNQRSQLFHLAIFSAFLTIFIHGLVDVPYFKNDLSVLFWILIALIIISNKQADLSDLKKETRPI